MIDGSEGSLKGSQCHWWDTKTLKIEESCDWLSRHETKSLLVY